MGKQPNKRMRTALVVSLLSMVLSVSLCAGTTLAWFWDVIENQNTIEIGSFGAKVTATLKNTKSAGTRLSATEVTLPAGFYDLNVRGTGNTPGYALIFLDAVLSDFKTEAYYTEQLTSRSNFTYQLFLNEATTVRVTTIWAEMEGDAPLQDGKIIFYGKPPEIVVPKEEQADDTQENTTDDGTISTDSTPTTGDSTSSTPTTGDSTSSTPTTGDSTSSTPTTGGNISSTPASDSAGGTSSVGSTDGTPSAGVDPE